MAHESAIPNVRTTSNGVKANMRKRLSVGKDPADAAACRLRKEAELNAKNNEFDFFQTFRNRSAEQLTGNHRLILKTQAGC